MLFAIETTCDTSNDWVVSVECVALTPVLRGFKCMNSSGKCLNARGPEVDAAPSGVNCLGFLATFLLPWRCVTRQQIHCPVECLL